MNNFRSNTALDHSEEEHSINFQSIFNKLLDKWHWFLISLIIFILASFLYNRFTPPVYNITAKILVNSDDKGGGVGKSTTALMDLSSLMGSSNSIDNEIQILKTRFMMEQVVRQMQLNVIYSEKKALFNTEVYTSPFEVVFITAIDTISTTQLKVAKLSEQKLRVSTEKFEKEIVWNQNFNLPGVGNIKLVPNPLVKFGSNDFVVSITSIDARVGKLQNQLSVDVSNKQVSIIDLGITYTIPKKGEDILNNIIRKYVQSNLNDKNAIADSTYRFIKDRLNIIASELGDVETKVENFKQKNQLADMSEQGKLLVQNTGVFSSELAKAETQVNVLNGLEQYLKNENNKRVFPSALMPSDVVFSNLMSKYNSLLIEREQQLIGVTESSPFVKNIDMQIEGLRSDILSNIQSTKNTYLLTREKLKSQLATAEGQISGVPQIEKNYLKLARNQQIKQELYVFLMQKAEETAISKTSNMPIAKTIDPPKASFAPVSPKKTIVYLAGIIAGFIIPFGLILGIDVLNTSIRTKEDIFNLTQVPIIGEISHNQEGDNQIVGHQSRSAISEQFRALRTNLSFYLKNPGNKVILLTSSMSGEGKSFTAINLGNILALTGKKVLLMELDLRKPGLSAKLGINNKVGFSNFVVDSMLKLENIISPLDINPNLFLISSGPLPPNPAESLMSEHMSALIEELKKQFDYIILDAPPIGIIADAQLLAPYANVTLYLVRQKVTKKNQLQIVEDLYITGKMKNIGIVVNDITAKVYGYGYGYGSYGEDRPKSWFEKLLNR